MGKPILDATSVVEWKVDSPPANCTPTWVYIGHDCSKSDCISLVYTHTLKKRRSILASMGESKEGRFLGFL